MVEPTLYETYYDPKFDPYMKAIGRVVSKWAEFEFALNDAIWELSNVERLAGACATAQMIGPAPRFRCIAALLHVRRTPKELVKECNSLSVTAAGIAAQRNRYVHDPVMMNTEDGSISKIEATADRKVTHGIFRVNLTALNDLLVKIEDIEDQFNALFQRIRSDTPPWPRTQYEPSWGIHREYLGKDRALLEPEHQPEPSADSPGT